MDRKISILATLVAAATAQQVCTSKPETHPSMSWSKCDASSCTSQDASIVVDANWRWVHTVDGYTNCYSGNEWDSSICSTDEACAQKCCVDGAEYESTYGITTSGDSLDISFVTQSAQKNIGSRTYLMDGEDKYQMFELLGNEFTFDVDVSNLPCGLNGALYFVSMDADGGKSKYESNKAGAKYGTGYCDAQCPRDLKFINGLANIEGWEPSSNDPNAGVGNHGSCCAEMDIWEANKMATAFTPHTCDNLEQHMCEGDDCGGTYSATRYAGDCDPDGCDFNTYRMGNETFYGEGSEFNVDTSKPFTVVTQFLTGSSGDLSEIKRFYVQDGNVIANAESEIEGVSGNSITQEFCSAQKDAFGDNTGFAKHGGMSAMGKALADGMVLVMSLWDDHNSNMLWLDSTYPVDSTKAGADRGPCSTSSGVPSEVEAQVPNSNVVFSNVKFGPIGSTFNADGSSDSGSGSNPGNDNGSNPGNDNGSGSDDGNTGGNTGATAGHYEQCGGKNWSGATKCASGLTCKTVNEYYSQCL